MSDERIERVAETAMDLLDEQLMAGEITQHEYDEAMRRLDEWLAKQHTKLRNNPTTIH